MTQARCTLISLDATPYYHCVSRCVRRAFLCGNDPYTHHSYEHRRNWIAERLNQLSGSLIMQDMCYLPIALFLRHRYCGCAVLVLGIHVRPSFGQQFDDI